MAPADEIQQTSAARHRLYLKTVSLFLFEFHYFLSLALNTL